MVRILKLTQNANVLFDFGPDRYADGRKVRKDYLETYADLGIPTWVTGGLYKITHKITNKSYIGQTKRFFNRLWTHSQAKSSTAIHNAIKKYGWNAFSVEILLISHDRDYLNYCETACILSYDTLAPNGYNLNLGGDCYEISNELREKMRSEEIQAKIRETFLKNRHLHKTTYALGRKHHEMAPEIKTKWIQDREDTKRQKTQEEKDLVTQRRMATIHSNKKDNPDHGKWPKESIEAAVQKRRKTLQDKPPELELDRIKRFREKMAAKTPEERAAMKAKQQATRLANLAKASQ